MRQLPEGKQVILKINRILIRELKIGSVILKIIKQGP